MKITNINHNPYRAGSGRHTRFALYKVGMTVDEYINAGGNANAFNRDADSGAITVEGRAAAAASSSSPNHDPTLPKPSGRRGRAVRRALKATIVPHDFPPDTLIPVVKADYSGKQTAHQDKFWVFAYQEDGTRWRLKQEIYSWGEADFQMKGVLECKTIQPKWWDCVGKPFLE